MSVKVLRDNTISYPLTSLDLEVGNAYETEENDIVIACCVSNRELLAFSITGKRYYFSYENTKFRHISLEVTVS